MARTSMTRDDIFKEVKERGSTNAENVFELLRCYTSQKNRTDITASTDDLECNKANYDNLIYHYFTNVVLYQKNREETYCKRNRNDCKKKDCLFDVNKSVWFRTGLFHSVPDNVENKYPVAKEIFLKLKSNHNILHKKGAHDYHPPLLYSDLYKDLKKISENDIIINVEPPFCTERNNYNDSKNKSLVLNVFFALFLAYYGGISIEDINNIIDKDKPTITPIFNKAEAFKWFSENTGDDSRFNNINNILEASILPDGIIEGSNKKISLSKIIENKTEKKKTKKNNEEDSADNITTTFEENEPDMRYLYIYGDSGQGKTTTFFSLMKDKYFKSEDPEKGTVLEFAEKDEFIPVYIPLQKSNGTAKTYGKDVFCESSSELGTRKNGNFLRRVIMSFVENTSFDDINYAEDAAKSRIRSISERTDMVVLLDGINEISKDFKQNEESISVIKFIKEEIEELKEEFPKLRIVVSGQKESDCPEGFTKVKVCELEDDAIIGFLEKEAEKAGEENGIRRQALEKKIEKVKKDPELRKVLGRPLFLYMYSKTGEKEVSARGEIMDEFFCGTEVGLYTDINSKGSYNIADRLSLMTGDKAKRRAVAIIMDFVLPELAWNEGMIFSENDIENALNNLCAGRSNSFVFSDDSLFGKFGRNAFSKYKDPDNDDFFVKDVLKEALDSKYSKQNHNENTDEVTKLVKKLLAEYVSNNGSIEIPNFSEFEGLIKHSLSLHHIAFLDGSDYRFAHDQYCAFFKAKYIANYLLLANSMMHSGKECDIRRDNANFVSAYNLLAQKLGKEALDLTTLTLVGEILGEHRNAPCYSVSQEKWLYYADESADEEVNVPFSRRQVIDHMLEICRLGKPNESSEEYEKWKTIIWNLVELLKATRKDLAGVKFDAFDISDVRLNGTVLSHDCLYAKMRGTVLSYNSVFPSGHASPITALAFNPKNPDMLLSGDFDGVIKEWDVRTRNCTKTINAHAKGNIYNIKFNPLESKFIVFGNPEGIWLVNREIGKHTLLCERGDTPSFSSDGEFIAVGCQDGVRLYKHDNDSYKPINPLKSDAVLFDPVLCEFNPQNHNQLFLSSDRQIQIWNNIFSEEPEVIKKEYSEGLGRYATYSPDGKEIIVLTSAKAFKLDLDTLEEEKIDVETKLADKIKPFSEGYIVLNEYEHLMSFGIDEFDKIKSSAKGALLKLKSGKEEVVCKSRVECFDVNSNGVIAAAKGNNGEEIDIFYPNDSCVTIRGSIADIDKVITDSNDNIYIACYDGCKKFSIAFDDGEPRIKCLGTALNGVSVEDIDFFKDDLLVRADSFLGILDPDHFILKEKCEITKKKIITKSPVGLVVWYGDSIKTEKDFSEEEIAEFEKEYCEYRRKFVSHSGKYYIKYTETDDGIDVELFDSSSKQLLDSISSDYAKVGGNAFFNNSDTAVAFTGCIFHDHEWKYFVKIFKITENGKLSETDVSIQYNPYISDICFLPGDKYMLVSYRDKTADIRSAEDGSLIGRIENIPGLYLSGVVLQRDHLKNFSEEDIEKLKLYGAEIQ